MTRPSSTDDPRLGDTAESETKKARPDRDETAKDLVSQNTAVDRLFCVQPSIDLSNDAMACSGTFRAAEVENGRTREQSSIKTVRSSSLGRRTV